MGESFCDLESGKDFFRQDLKNINHKRKFDELDFVKIKIFCYLKDIVKKIKSQAEGWEKIVKKIICQVKNLNPQYTKNS